MADSPTIATTAIVASFLRNDTMLVRLAREIAMDMRELPELLKLLSLNQEQWEAIQRNPRFLEILQSEVVAWNSAKNTAERIKVKSLSFVEEMLPELYARANDKTENLLHKVEIVKTIAKFAALGVGGADVVALGDRFSVTINLGTDHSIKIDKGLPAQVIDVTPEEVS